MKIVKVLRKYSFALFFYEQYSIHPTLKQYPIFTKSCIIFTFTVYVQ